MRGAGTPADDAYDDGDVERKNVMPNLWPYFSSSCFSGFSGNNSENFYAVYQRVFEEIWNCEPAERRAKGFPVLGTVSSPWKVLKFLRFLICFKQSAGGQGVLLFLDKFCVRELVCLGGQVANSGW